MINITAMTTMCADIFDSTGEIFPGGEALNFAAVACRYPHIKVGIMGAVGDDECGKAVLNSIHGKSIDKSSIHIIKNGITASNRIYLLLPFLAERNTGLMQFLSLRLLTLQAVVTATMLLSYVLM